MTGKAVRILISSGVVLATIFLLVLLCAVGKERRRSAVCTGVEIDILDSTKLGFLSKDDIKRYLSEGGVEVTGVKMDSIDLGGIESLLDDRSAVLKSQAYTTKDGTLHIDITQREPLILFKKGSSSFYADEKGFLFPSSKEYGGKVVVVEGSIPIQVEDGYKGRPATAKEQKWLEDMIAAIKYLRGEKTWKSAIRAITVEGDGDLVLYPVKGKERFIFGRPESIKSKLSRIDDYYRYIVPSKGENYYSIVNVKFDGQIVCK